MSKIIIDDIPDDFLRIRGTSPGEFAREMRIAAAMYWYSRVEISQERAAQIAGLNRKEFMKEVAREKIEYDLDFEDIKREVERG
ncbi:MAG: UPF0175 family protein [Hormoscilla sp. GM102CHS1]|nr:UPF0175 family protein [Hormoscilla sp. GM102CHS1]MBO1346855.1 UPF0175 family protein [Hormoscilla sp. GUM202]